MNARAQAEHTIREALRELENWGAVAQFSLIDYSDIKQQKMQVIKDWKDLFTQIGDNQSLLSSLKDSSYYKNFGRHSSQCEHEPLIVIDGHF